MTGCGIGNWLGLGGSAFGNGAFGITGAAGCLKRLLLVGGVGNSNRFCATDLIGGSALVDVTSGAEKRLLERTGGAVTGIEADALLDEDDKGANRLSVFGAGDTPKSPNRLREVLLLPASPNLGSNDAGELPNALSTCKPESFGKRDANVWLVELIAGLDMAALADPPSCSFESGAVEAVSVPRVDERNLAKWSESANMLAGGSGGVNGLVETGIGLKDDFELLDRGSSTGNST